MRSLTEKEIQSVIALPKILRLRDGQYLEKLRKLLLENLTYINGFQAANMEHIALLKQWNFTGKKSMGIIVCISGTGPAGISGRHS